MPGCGWEARYNSKPTEAACAGDSLQGDGSHTGPDVVEAGSGVRAQAEATAVISAREYGAGGEDTDKQMGLKGIGEADFTWGEGETRPRFELGSEDG